MSLGAPQAAAALQWLSSLCDFLLEVSLAYCLCWILVRFSNSPAVRFAVWMVFLLGSATCWLGMLLQAATSMPATFTFTVSTPVANLRPAFPLAAAPNWPISALAADAISRALPLLGISYLLTLCVLAVASFLRQRRLQEALAFRTAPPAALHRSLENLAREMRLGACQLWLLPALPSPATTGWRTPCIYLPPECGEEDGLALDSILRHELAHVRRRDTVWGSAARLCRALLFFHPALHGAFAALQLERELACDRMVLRAQPEKRDVYADVLVRFGWKALAPGRSERIGIAFAASASVLHSRVQAILAGESAVAPGACMLQGLLSVAALCVAALLAPALWIGFHLPAPRPVIKAAAPPEQSAHFARHPRMSRPVSALKGPTPMATSLAITTSPPSPGASLLPAVEDAPLREVRYHSDSPVVQPEYVAREDVSEEDSTGSQATGAAPRKRGRRVSATTVTALVGAVITLHGLLDHDHGHE